MYLVMNKLYSVKQTDDNLLTFDDRKRFEQMEHPMNQVIEDMEYMFGNMVYDTKPIHLKVVKD